MTFAEDGRVYSLLRRRAAGYLPAHSKIVRRSIFMAPCRSSRLVRSLVIASLLSAGLALVWQDAEAAPNYYSGDVKSKRSKLRVVKPDAGTYTVGDRVLVSWRKSTPGTEVVITVHMASGSGARGKRMLTIDAPSSVKAHWKEKGGALYWTIPKNWTPGRYVIQVRAGSYLASSESFVVNRPKVEPPKLEPEKLGSSGVVRSVDVEDRGQRGAVVIKTDAGEDRYEWGKEHCPKLEGGLPGALVLLSKMDDAQITPRVREVTFQGKTTQTCIVGVNSERPLPDVEGAVDEPEEGADES